MTTHKGNEMTKDYRKLTQGHGTDATPDRGRKFGTQIQEVKMATNESGYRYRFNPAKSIEDSLIMGGSRSYAHEGTHDPHARSQAQHLRDVARGGKR